MFTTFDTFAQSKFQVFTDRFQMTTGKTCYWLAKLCVHIGAIGLMLATGLLFSADMNPLKNPVFVGLYALAIAAILYYELRMLNKINLYLSAETRMYPLTNSDRVARWVFLLFAISPSEQAFNYAMDVVCCMWWLTRMFLGCRPQPPAPPKKAAFAEA